MMTTKITLDELLEQMLLQNASDLYITYGCPPSLRLSNRIVTLSDDLLDEDDIGLLIRAILTEEQLEEFYMALEYNSAIHWQDRARFRINVFQQQSHLGMVIRRIKTEIPSLESLQLPPIYSQLVMQRRGLILLAGQTGSGKSTSLASMINYRNVNGAGHIITIEDPVEFLHSHQGCIITQRDVGLDTYSYGMALKNALRQRPDLVLIGEIRDRETMEHAINFAETGHLVLATLHANNANQTIERIINFFPEEKHKQALLNLSLNLKAVLSQRLLLKTDGERIAAIEILLNNGLIKTLIEEGNVRQIKEMMSRGRDEGMQTFDQHILDLFTDGHISEETALGEADNPSNIRLHIRQIHASNQSLSKNSPARNDINNNGDGFRV